MPELPEVETIRRDLTRHVLGKTVKDVSVSHAKVVGGDIEAFAGALAGKRFQEIDRVGKLLIFSFGREQFLLVHLKMTGQLIYHAGEFIIAGGHSLTSTSEVYPAQSARGGRRRAGGHSQTDDPEVQPGKHTRIAIGFADGSKLFFHDMRLFGFMRMVNEAGRSKAISAFGIEPLTALFTLEKFAGVFRGRKTSVKAVLLNQSLIAGIGNIYADEICFSAGIRPSRQASRVTKAEALALYAATKQIIKRAIKERGTTFNTYVDGAGNKGNFVRFLQVYGRGGQPCRHCGKTLMKKRVAGRGTVFCLSCQK